MLMNDMGARCRRRIQMCRTVKPNNFKNRSRVSFPSSDKSKFMCKNQPRSITKQPPPPHNNNNNNSIIGGVIEDGRKETKTAAVATDFKINNGFLSISNGITPPPDGCKCLNDLWQSQCKLISYLKTQIEEKQEKKTAVLKDTGKLSRKFEKEASGSGWSDSLPSDISKASGGPFSLDDSLSVEGGKKGLSLAKITRELLKSVVRTEKQYYITRRYCFTQQKLMKLLRDKLVQTELALNRAIADQETWKIRLKRKERRTLISAHTGSTTLTDGFSVQKNRPKADSCFGKIFAGETNGVRWSETGRKRRSNTSIEMNSTESEEKIVCVRVPLPVEPLESHCSDIEVPSFRVASVNPLSGSKRNARISESLEDDIFDKRHLKQETEEKRIVRWDRKRHREEQMRKKLQESSRCSVVEKYGKRDDGITTEIWKPEDSERKNIVLHFKPKNYYLWFQLEEFR